jgi:hypothetical protein
MNWIKYGQEKGAIPADLDTEAAASMFVTFSYGLRVRQLIDPEPGQQHTAPQEVMKLMIENRQSSFAENWKLLHIRNVFRIMTLGKAS